MSSLGEELPCLSYHQPLPEVLPAVGMSPANAHCEAKLAQSTPEKRA